eukprot:Lithocolla_globosa_v1_NODE_72_length_6942_cov_12.745027.p4 type:complete len:108 gc:universal NODE_72_length_6942_cov_12.745027:6665-6342(-)
MRKHHHHHHQTRRVWASPAGHVTASQWRCSPSVRPSPVLLVRRVIMRRFACNRSYFCNKKPKQLIPGLYLTLNVALKCTEKISTTATSKQSVDKASSPSLSIKLLLI